MDHIKTNSESQITVQYRDGIKIQKFSHTELIEKIIEPDFLFSPPPSYLGSGPLRVGKTDSDVVCLCSIYIELFRNVYFAGV